MTCLWCNCTIIPETTWKTLFLPNAMQVICDDCQSKLQTLKTPRCRTCSAETTKGKCPDCIWWDRYFEAGDVFDSHYAVYKYNDFLQTVIAKWKYRGDYELGFMFAAPMAAAFKRAFGHIKKDVLIVPVPLSHKRLTERKFNQAEMLARFLPGKPRMLVKRLNSEKQSKKTRYDRIFSTNDFTVSQSVNHPVLLIDDIYTTGATLRHIAVQLKASGCPEVHGLTLARG